MAVQGNEFAIIGDDFSVTDNTDDYAICVGNTSSGATGFWESESVGSFDSVTISSTDGTVYVGSSVGSDSVLYSFSTSATENWSTDFVSGKVDNSTVVDNSGDVHHLWRRYAAVYLIGKPRQLIREQWRPSPTTFAGATHFAYDQNGHEVSRKLPNGEQESFTYDVYGREATHTDFDGDVTTYTYDSLGRVSQIVYIGRISGSGKATRKR